MDVGITETWRAGFDVLWEIDLFGGARQTRRAISAEVEAAAADLEAARIALVAEVAQAYFSLRAEQDRLMAEHDARQAAWFYDFLARLFGRAD